MSPKNIKYVISLFIFFLNINILPKELNKNIEQKELIWVGSKNSKMYKQLQKNSQGIVVQWNDNNGTIGTMIRASEFSGAIEVKNKKTQIWVDVTVPSNNGVINVDKLFNLAIIASSCDLVTTNILLSNSTSSAEVYFEDKPIGSIKSDGRFYYESKGVCKDSMVNLLITKSKCDPYKASFKASENPQKYEGSASLKCK